MKKNIVIQKWKKNVKRFSYSVPKYLIVRLLLQSDYGLVLSGLLLNTILQKPRE